MDVVALDLQGLKLIKPKVHRDVRGSFVEAYHARRYTDGGILETFVQDNHSISAPGTLRGLHLQTAPGQGKLVRVAMGAIFDVAVDVRRGSPTFGQWRGVELDGELHHQLMVPVGFAHGFCVLRGPAHVLYKVTAPFDPSCERSIAWNDPDIGIDWPLDQPVLSARDQRAPPLAALEPF